MICIEGSGDIEAGILACRTSVDPVVQVYHSINEVEEYLQWIPLVDPVQEFFCSTECTHNLNLWCTEYCTV